MVSAIPHALLIAHAYPPDSNAGVEQYTARLAAALGGCGWRATVLTARVRPGAPQNSVLREHIDGVPVLGLVQNWPYRDLPEAADDPALDRALARLVEDLRPDVIAIQTLFGLSLGFVDVAADLGVPVVLHLHDGWFVCPSGGQRRHPDGSLCLPVDPSRCGACYDRFRHREGPLERWGRQAAARMPDMLPPDALHRAFAALPSPARGALKQANERGARLLGQLRRPAEAVGVDPRIAARARRVDAVLARCALAVSPSQFQADSLTAEGLPLPDLRVVPTGVAGTRRALPPGETLRVLFLGTFVEHKGPQVLADALASLPGSVAGRIEALAVGPAPFPAWRAEVEERGAGRLRIGESVGPDAVPDLFAAHHVVVIPSLWPENAPLVALEARAAGRAVVASDLGGLKELVLEGRDGLRFPPGDSLRLASILTELTDRARLEDLCAAVRPPPTLGDWADGVVEAWGHALEAAP